MKIGLSSRFIKNAKKLSQQEKDELDTRTGWFGNDPRDPRLKTHALTGQLKGYFSFSITRKKRVKFIFLENDKILFVDVGSHDEVY